MDILLALIDNGVISASLIQSIVSLCGRNRDKSSMTHGFSINTKQKVDKENFSKISIEKAKLYVVSMSWLPAEEFLVISYLGDNKMLALVITKVIVAKVENLKLCNYRFFPRQKLKIRMQKDTFDHNCSESHQSIKHNNFLFFPLTHNSR